MPGLVRLQDVSLISWERLPGHVLPSEPIPVVVPDLAVEVLSEETRQEMEVKLRDYFVSRSAAGEPSMRARQGPRPHQSRQESEEFGRRATEPRRRRGAAGTESAVSDIFADVPSGRRRPRRSRRRSPDARLDGSDRTGVWTLHPFAARRRIRRGTGCPRDGGRRTVARRPASVSAPNAPRHRRPRRRTRLHRAWRRGHRLRSGLVGGSLPPRTRSLGLFVPGTWLAVSSLASRRSETSQPARSRQVGCAKDGVRSDRASGHSCATRSPRRRIMAVASRCASRPIIRT